MGPLLGVTVGGSVGVRVGSFVGDLVAKEESEVKWGLYLA